jgi:four helix bundle protein
MRRSTVSVAANIADGFSKRGRSDKARYMNIAQGSLEELRYYFILAHELEYLTGKGAETSDVDEVARLLGGILSNPRSSELLALSS